MGFYRALIQATPQSMPGGFYSSSWQTAKEEVAGYLTRIRFNARITSLNITNLISNSINLSDVNYPDFPVFGTGTNANNVNGINISNYTKLFLNSNCANMFTSCYNCTDWSGLNLFDWTYVTDCTNMFRNCTNFNQSVTIGNNVVSCGSMFMRCYALNQPVTIGNNVINMSSMFRITETATSWADVPSAPIPDIYVKGNTYRNIAARQSLARSMNTGSLSNNITRNYRTNIHFNAILQNCFNLTLGLNTLTGTDITWTPMDDGNGYYNTLANIYLYNNYEG